MNQPVLVAARMEAITPHQSTRPTLPTINASYSDWVCFQLTYHTSQHDMPKGPFTPFKNVNCSMSITIVHILAPIMVNLACSCFVLIFLCAEVRIIKANKRSSNYVRLHLINYLICIMIGLKIVCHNAYAQTDNVYAHTVNDGERSTF